MLAAAETPAPAIDAWIAAGRALIAERDAAQWRLADWIVTGRQDLGRAGGVPSAAERLNITAHKLRSLAMVATAFPPDCRDARLGFDVHAHLAGLPVDRRVDAQARAVAEGWGERQARAAAVEDRQERAVFVDDDAETRMAVEMMRAWNRAIPESRSYFMALAERAGSAAIDEDANV